MMAPLAITAHLDPLGAPLSLPEGYIHLDGILAYAVVIRDEVPTASIEAELVPIEIPLEREPAGRFHLCSAAAPRWELHELHWTNRRFPWELAAVMTEMTRARIGAGAQKSYRIPVEAGRVQGDALTWFAVGDPEPVRDLLALVHGIGKRRGVGLGQVARWVVEDVEPWAGFPVLTREGHPLRHLPPDWPGLRAGTAQRLGNLTYPYWRRSAETVVVVPAA